MKEQYKSYEANQNMAASNPVIKISHYDDDKHIKTDTFPVSHFLDQTSKEMKTLKYS